MGPALIIWDRPVAPRGYISLLVRSNVAIAQCIGFRAALRGEGVAALHTSACIIRSWQCTFRTSARITFGGGGVQPHNPPPPPPPPSGCAPAVTVHGLSRPLLFWAGLHSVVPDSIRSPGQDVFNGPTSRQQYPNHQQQ